MRVPIVVAGMVATGLAVTGVLVMAAGAETTATSAPASPPLRTVSAQGVATEPIATAASAEAATAVYRQAMAAAIGDGHAKAQFLAEKASAMVGQVQSIGEGGGYIQCPEGVEYEGAQPDFGSAGAVFAGAVAPAAPVRSPALHRAPVTHHRRHHAARKAALESCTLSTQVSLVYQLS
jgi:uncharacterized protein YggE